MVNEWHYPDEGCQDSHCYSCGIDHHGDAWMWCFECGHAYRTFKDLRDAYLAEAPYGRWSWRWWRARFGPRWLVERYMTFCPLCLHSF